MSQLSFPAKDKNEKKFLGFSFFFLMDADETTVKDGSHVLCVYKCEDPAKIEVSTSLICSVSLSRQMAFLH